MSEILQAAGEEQREDLADEYAHKNKVRVKAIGRLDLLPKNALGTPLTCPSKILRLSFELLEKSD